MSSLLLSLTIPKRDSPYRLHHARHHERVVVLFARSLTRPISRVVTPERRRGSGRIGILAGLLGQSATGGRSLGAGGSHRGVLIFLEEMSSMVIQNADNASKQ
jgi:hypothetical protein